MTVKIKTYIEKKRGKKYWLQKKRKKYRLKTNFPFSFYNFLLYFKKTNHYFLLCLEQVCVTITLSANSFSFTMQHLLEETLRR